MASCPFCGCDPYHYVDNGVGMERVAIVCCELGIEYMSPRDEPSDTVTISRVTFNSIADIMRSLRTLGLSPEIEL